MPIIRLPIELVGRILPDWYTILSMYYYCLELEGNGWSLVIMSVGLSFQFHNYDVMSSEFKCLSFATLEYFTFSLFSLSSCVVGMLYILGFSCHKKNTGRPCNVNTRASSDLDHSWHFSFSGPSIFNKLSRITS